jgi:PHD/YefM family antitoxin component YafN of YafNO toxin-antitoxin module
MDQAADTHEPILITGKRSDSVLVAAEDWQAIQETLHLLSVQGMRESIKEGMAQTPENCAKELDWRVGKWSMPSMHKKMPKN